MFLRSKIQEMIPRRRSRSMNGGGGGAARATSSTVPCEGGAAACALFAAPRLLHSASLPSSSYGAKNGGGGGGGLDGETATYTMSPTSVLDAAAAFAPSPDAGGKRRPWCDGAAGTHGLADALEYSAGDDAQKRNFLAAASGKAVRVPLVRSCSLDRRVEFGVKNKSSWLPLRAAGRAEEAPASPGEMEPSSEDYTCVISRGPNPRTVHIFGDRVIEGGGNGGDPPAAAAVDREESSPRSINLPARGDRGFLSL